MLYLFGIEVLRLTGAGLGSRGVTAIAEGIKAAVKAAEAVRTSVPPMRCRLLELDLQHNDAREAGSEVLADAIAHTRDLQKFLFAGNRPAYEGVSKLTSALVKCPALQVWPRHSCPHFCQSSSQAMAHHRGATACL
jgi:hypothetical protein